MNIIKDNPFRILGICTNASARDIAANTHRISAYQRVGKETTFPTDLVGLLGKCERTEDKIADAQAKINLQSDKIKYALFWFIKGDAADEIAINNISAGNIDKGKNIWGRGRYYSFKINLGVLSLIQQDYQTAVRQISSVINNDNDRQIFVKSICGDTFHIDKSSLSDMFVEGMLEMVDPEKLLSVYNTIEEDMSATTRLKNRVAEQYVDKIDSEMSTAQVVNANNASESYNAGVRLMNNTKTALQKLRSIVGSNDIKYTRLADRLANQILQCGINYFNNTTESKSTSISKAYTLQQYAGQIAVGQVAKDRCKKNLEILNNLKEEAKIETDLNYIANQIKSLSSYSSIQTAIDMVKNCKPHLISIKSVLGSNNETYLNISNAVANRALAISIDKINADQNRLTSRIDLYAGSISTIIETTKSDIEASLRLFNNIQELDMTPQMRQHVSSNRSTLISLRDSINSLYSSITGSSYGGYSGRSSGGYSGDYSSGSSSGSGCMVVVVALIIFGCIGALLI
jgi:hypothetical protein